jgi:hypothetical protein
MSTPSKFCARTMVSSCDTTEASLPKQYSQQSLLSPAHDPPIPAPPNERITFFPWERQRSTRSCRFWLLQMGTGEPIVHWLSQLFLLGFQVYETAKAMTMWVYSSYCSGVGHACQFPR